MSAVFKPNLNMDLRSRAELHRATLQDYRSESIRVQLEADARNLKLLQGDQRLVSLCRAYFLADEVQRDHLAGEAEKVLAEVEKAAA